MDRGRSGLVGQYHQHQYAHRTSERHAGRRSHWRCRSRHRLPATDSHPLLLHLLHGRFWLYGTSSLHHGQTDAQDGTTWQVVHPTYHGLRLQRTCSHGNAHHRESSLTTHHHAHTATHELFGTSAYLHHGNRHFLCPAISLAHHGVALSHRHLPCCDTESHLRKLCHQRRRHTFCDGTTTLSLPHLESHWSTHLGER